MRYDYQAELDAETAAAHTPFDQLVDLVSDTMLEDPTVIDIDIPPEKLGKSAEIAGVIGKLGLWNSAIALENEAFPDKTLLEDLDQNVDRLLLPVDQEVQTKIEQLGVAIIDEAFKCLGNDAEDQVALFKAATSDKERVEVCNWLIRRLAAIEAKASEQAPKENTPEKLFYHPARLSPKIIGSYPEINVGPTCLGYSILIAAFFEKTGTLYSHVGVARTAGDETRLTQSQSVGRICDTAEKHGIKLPQTISDIFKNMLQEIKTAGRHRGFHAAIVARLSKDSWIQIDPNYDANTLLAYESGEDIEKNYALLGGLNILAPGIEFESWQGVDLPAGAYYLVADEQIKQTPSVQEVDAFLQEVPVETAYAEIIETQFKTLINPSRAIIKEALDFTMARYCERLELPISPAEYLQEAIHDTLITYVFPEAVDGDITACIERCQHDTAYRLRRAEDLTLAPLYTLLRLQTAHGNAVIDQSFTYPHALLDYGMPAYRIGASVLSDFAVYCGDELPFSFWMTYWPSAVSFAEHHQQANTPAQQTLKKQITADLRAQYLKYNAVNDIINNVQE